MLPRRHRCEMRADGTKELLACSDGYRESTESWADVLRDRECLMFCVRGRVRGVSPFYQMSC